MLFLLIIVFLVILSIYLIVKFEIYEPEVLVFPVMPAGFFIVLSIFLWVEKEKHRNHEEIHVNIIQENNKQYVWVPNYGKNKQERIDLTEKYGRIFENEATFIVYEQSIWHWPRGPQVVLTE